MTLYFWGLINYSYSIVIWLSLVYIRKAMHVSYSIQLRHHIVCSGLTWNGVTL